MSEVPLLEIRDLTLARGERRVLDGFNLSVRRGEVHGLLGPNGAGKSSAFSVLIGLLPPSGGELLLQGETVPFGGSRLKKRMGVVFQHPALDPRLTARVNLSLAAGLYGLGGAEQKRRIDEMVAFADLEGRDREPVKKLSGGMRRRLEIARALLHSPAFLLMDEPTTGLDEASFARTWKTLRALSEEKGVTILLTTHRAEEAELCDRLSFLSGGRVVTEGTPDELRDGVGGDVIEIETAAPEEAKAALVGKLGADVEVLAGRVRIVAEKGHELVPRVVEALPRGSIRSLSLHRPGLSDVFLGMTGRELGEDEVREEAK